MTASGAPLILPTAEPTGEKDALQATAQLLTQSLEALRLAERVERALCATGYGPLRRIEVAVHARLVILAGRVPSYYLKQVAQATVQAVPGAHRIRNDLDVAGPI
ncbi:MAG TPA: BON domain-containing protein [Gemmataceae bacterium]|jgi:osmotically-inducible protein OsmY